MNNSSRVVILAVMFLLPFEATAQRPSPDAFALTHVAVIDVVGGRAITDMTVIVEHGRIAALGRSGALHPPAVAQVVDATGKFLIPGLWDMHVHWYVRDYLPLFLANGVTGIRIMWGLSVNHDWQRALQQGTLLGPRMLIASAVIDGPNPVQRLPRETFLAIADEAKKQGLSFAGHVPKVMSAGEASDAGMKSIEHLTGVLEASNTHEEELRVATSAQARQTMKQGFSRDKEEALLQRFKRNHTWQTPTLVLHRVVEVADPSALASDPRLKYLPASLTTSWLRVKDLVAARPPEQVEFMRWLYATQGETVAMMSRIGVGLLAGTDTRNPYCLPGFSLHDELALMVDSGLTPAEALRTATINPARFLEREKDLGTIARGKAADLVLLDANPLQDIRNTTRINAVVVNGRLLDRAALDSMLSRVEMFAAADK